MIKKEVILMFIGCISSIWLFGQKFQDIEVTHNLEVKGDFVYQNKIISPGIANVKEDYISSEFYDGLTSYPWKATSYGTVLGIVSNTSSEAGHNGLTTIASSTSTNSGASLTIGNILLVGDESTTGIFLHQTASTTITFYYGFFDTGYTITTPSNGVYFILNGTTVTPTIKVSGSATTGTTYTITQGVYYKYNIIITSDKSAAIFRIYNASGTSVYTAKVTATVPTTTLVHGCKASRTSASSVVMMVIDYMDVDFSNSNSMLD